MKLTEIFSGGLKGPQEDDHVYRKLEYAPWPGSVSAHSLWAEEERRQLDGAIQDSSSDQKEKRDLEALLGQYFQFLR